MTVNRLHDLTSRLTVMKARSAGETHLSLCQTI